MALKFLLPFEYLNLLFLFKEKKNGIKIKVESYRSCENF